jgi:integrase
MRAKLTKILVRQLPPLPDRDLLVWDTEQTGLGLRISRGGARSWVFNYSLPGWRSPRRYTIGPVGPLTLDQARAKAGELRASVAQGLDPAEDKQARGKAPTVRDLEQRFMAEHVAYRSLGTRGTYASIWKLYLLPALGAKPVAEVRWEHLAELHRRMRTIPYMANRMLAVASKAWSLAKRWGWYPRALENPAREHDRYPERARGQALDRGELRRVGAALDAEPPGSIPVAAFQVLLLSGMRPSEVLGLRWEHLDGRVVRLAESKTGPRLAYLGAPAAAILEAVPLLGPYVFAGLDVAKPLHDLKGVWGRVRARAELPRELRLYDATRHTFTTWAEELEIPEDRRRRLVGHALQGIHSRYTHPRTELLLADADRVAGAIWEAMRGGGLPTTG